MTAYKFRVIFEDYEDVKRDIEIKPTQTFEDFHIAIQNAIGFDNSKGASFYMSNDNWIKGQEITLYATNDKVRKDAELMAKSRLCDFIADPHQKIYYIFDFAAGWGFYIELIKILKEDKNIDYPRCVTKIGDAPKQYGSTMLGKVNTDLDFIGENALDTEGDDEGDGMMNSFEEEPVMDDEGENPESEDEVQDTEDL